MNRNLKDLIDSIEEESRSRAELETALQSISEENKILKLRVQELQNLIDDLKDQNNVEEIEQIILPSEINVLKDMVISQRRELDEKDKLIEDLDAKLYSQNTEGINFDATDSRDDFSEEFISAQKLIVLLTDENKDYKSQIEQLKTQLDENQIKKTENEVEFSEKPQINEDEELINVKRLNFQLMEENGLLRLEIETLNSKLQERIDNLTSEELDQIKQENASLKSELESVQNKFEEYINLSLKESELAKEKNDLLISELEEAKAQNADLFSPPILSTVDALEFSKMKEKIENLEKKLQTSQKENEELSVIINDLKQKRLDNEIEQKNIEQELPKKLSSSLFYRMFLLLDKNQKLKIIGSLIQDLRNSDQEIKRNAINILTIIKDNNVFNALIELLEDKDWLVRYSIIKALSKYEKKKEELKPVLVKLTKDIDVDVRELALRILEEME
ncbi:MAG: HEAT repeat domain-containing protein [Candidatus Thorarchaeota archaeon]